MGEIPGNRTSAMLLLVMAILVGDGVRAGSSVLENAVDREEVRAFIGQHQAIAVARQSVRQQYFKVVVL